ncbi:MULTISPECIES: 30S ribosome-binding factor RbfA [unclassified Siphonobacter]|uniref:30S ribosome-binding factor RbfA n=1 Tax=unclassified Siphonobacter TaxID=2635712 RepID=UPI00277DC8AB|nr:MULTISPECIES: 30S ribosome-binding factor RbfA [unclassified Siphonobacter]MDQ1088175.1 ribosome-binding factor A [Siphonobacter sp. SORGH_AS_1065]MDR6194321.1 ribosome-binding factor A [Siphonobacter sp. SORGH_AS_0500]
MESKRQQKFARQVQKDLGDIFQKEMRNQFGNAFITITDVKVSPDLGLARAYLSFLLTDDKDQLLKNIQEKTKQIRQILANKIRNQVRVIPELQFFLDDTAEYAAKMDALFSGIVIPPASEDDAEEE